MESGLQSVRDYIANFSLNNRLRLPNIHTRKTQVESIELDNTSIEQYINEFWTARQRQAYSLHEISYRACFKPQLPRFFINLLTRKGDTVYDPFSGRGTTPVEAGLMGRYVVSNDVNPISKIFTYPRFLLPTLKEVEKRLQEIEVDYHTTSEIDLSMFYHPDTNAEIVSLKNYLQKRKENREQDYIDNWIRMVATNRLTGHSPGFFSVYTLPPNQAISRQRQIEINKKREQAPPYRDVKDLILNKTKSLLKDIDDNTRSRLAQIGNKSRFYECDARKNDSIDSNSVQLTVTSPPFLNVVQYSRDNWLRCWFNSLNEEEIERNITVCSSLQKWCEVMQEVFHELFRITKAGGWVAFEVGEVRKGKVRLDEHITKIGTNAGFDCFGILINSQNFTKTSNIWGVNNNTKGTNTNRIVMFYKAANSV